MAPPGSVAFCQENGWMSAEIFLQWLGHFVRFAKANKDNQVLLLLDGHSSLKSFEVLERNSVMAEAKSWKTSHPISSSANIWKSILKGGSSFYYHKCIY